MTSWNEFLRSDEFRNYRRKQIEAVASHLKKSSYQILTNGKVDLAAIQGKLEMINVFLKVPESLTRDKETLDILAVQLDEDVSNVAQYLIRSAMAE